MAGPAREAVRSITPALSVLGVATMTDVHYSVLSRPRTLAWLFAVLGVVALALAASGVYALMSYVVTQRTHEIGVRTALGAGPWRLVGGFVREGTTVVATGAAVGVACSWVLARLVRGGLYGLSTVDPFSVLGASLIMIVVGVLATYLPARHAASVDPIVAMRD
jgi:putative ABC transport system permease protein